MTKEVTISDVAKAAGVGKGTVDRVIHNRGRVSEETAQKVTKVIQQLGYKPNMAARILARKKAYKIAVILRDKEKDFWNLVKKGINQAEAEHTAMGIVIDRFILNGFDDKEQIEIIKTVIAAQYDGLAIVPVLSKNVQKLLNQAVEEGIKVLVFNSRIECEKTCYVGEDAFQSGCTAGRMMSLLAKKEGRYLVVSQGKGINAGLEQRYQGFQHFIEADRPDLQCIGVIDGEGNYEKAYKRVSEFLSKEKPDAIYTTNAVVEVVAKAADEHGMGKQVKIIGHDVLPSTLKYLRQGVIDLLIDQEPQRQGFLAIDKLCRALLLDEKLEDEYTRIEIIIAENERYR